MDHVPNFSARPSLTTGSPLAAVANGLLIPLLVQQIAQGRQEDVLPLLSYGAAIWATNVMLFALGYWEFDPRRPVIRLAGGEFARTSHSSDAKPRAVLAGLGTSLRRLPVPVLHYATAFSPTEDMPLLRWAKDGHARSMSSVTGHDRAGHRSRLGLFT